MPYNPQGRLDELEAIAARLQEDLLASLCGPAGASGKDGREGEEGPAPSGKVRRPVGAAGSVLVVLVVKLRHAEGS